MTMMHIRMHTRRSARTLLAVAAALSMLGAACGSDSKTEAGDGEATTSAPAATTAPETTEPETTGAETTTTEPESSVVPSSSPKADTTTSEAVGDIDRSDWPDTLNFGVVPAENSSSLEESYAGLISLLNDELGIEVELFQATDYAGIIEAQIAGKVDLAQYGPFSYVLAKQNGADIRPIGAIVDGPDEEPGYQSYGIARADNGDINALADFKGRNVCFVDPGSTSGFLYPSAGLLGEGIDPEADVTPVFAGGHDASVISVKNGDCDAGFAFDNMVDKTLIESGDIAEGEIKVVWKSEIIAGSPLAVSLGLPETLVAELDRLIIEEANRDAMLAAGRCSSEETCGVTDEDAWGWIPVDDSLYDGVRAVCAATKAEACG